MRKSYIFPAGGSILFGLCEENPQKQLNQRLKKEDSSKDFLLSQPTVLRDPRGFQLVINTRLVNYFYWLIN